MDTVFDICIIGGGAAGIMAAFSARKHHVDASIVLLDRTFELGRKLIVSGAGRGNLTNIHLEHNLTDFIHGPKDLITNIFSQFGYQDITAFFKNLGIPLYEEQKTGKGKIFPVIDHAKTVRDILVDELSKQHIVIHTNSEVKAVQYKQDLWNIQTEKEEIKAENIILSCGGKTYPSLGANGSGYVLAQRIGHTIIDPVPSAVPVVSKNILSHLLQGEKLMMQVTIKGTQRMVTGDVLFTQYGLSGSAILDISRDISLAIHRDSKKDITLHLSFFPGKTKNEIQEMIEEQWKNKKDALVSRSVWGLLTEKVAGAVCAASAIPKEQTVSNMADEEKQRFIQTLASYEAVVTDTRGWNEAEFTTGGVTTTEVDEHTLASFKAPHCYLAGEILDVDGDIGGFNLSWAWSSGWVAGKLQ